MRQRGEVRVCLFGSEIFEESNNESSRFYSFPELTWEIRPTRRLRFLPWAAEGSRVRSK